MSDERIELPLDVVIDARNDLRFTVASIRSPEAGSFVLALLGVSNSGGRIGHARLDCGKLLFIDALPPGCESYSERSDAGRALRLELVHTIRRAFDQYRAEPVKS